MRFKFEDLRVWQDALDYGDTAYQLIAQLPDSERFNLAEQFRKAATSIALNIAEGSTSQSREENMRFLGYRIRSAVECVACHRWIVRRGYRVDSNELERAEEQIVVLFRRLQAFRHSLRKGQRKG